MRSAGRAGTTWTGIHLSACLLFVGCAERSHERAVATAAAENQQLEEACVRRHPQPPSAQRADMYGTVLATLVRADCRLRTALSLAPAWSSDPSTGDAEPTRWTASDAYRSDGRGVARASPVARRD